MSLFFFNATKRIKKKYRSFLDHIYKKKTFKYKVTEQINRFKEQYMLLIVNFERLYNI